MRECPKKQGGQLLRGTVRGWPLASTHTGIYTSIKTGGKKVRRKGRRGGTAKEKGREGGKKIKI